MKRRSEGGEVVPSLRDKIIGLGERSIRKSYYPQLLRQLEETEQSRSSLANTIQDLEDARSSLAESQARYRSLVENLNDVIFSLDAQGRVTYISPVVRSYGGAQPEQIIGQPFVALVHPEDQPVWLAGFARVLAGRPEPHEFRLLGKDGTIRYVLTSSRPLLDGAGVVGLTGVMSDISERRRSEAESKLNTERMNALLQLNQMTGATLEAITGFAFEAAVRLTRSRLGYLAFMNEDETVMTMQLWTRGAVAECKVPGMPRIFPVETTGLWGEAVRQRRPIVTNDYVASPWKKGTPEGHVRLTRHMNLPIIVGGKIVLVAGVGNKPEDYDDADVRQLALLMEGLWHLIERERAEEENPHAQPRARTAGGRTHRAA